MSIIYSYPLDILDTKVNPLSTSIVDNGVAKHHLLDFDGTNYGTLESPIDTAEAG